MLLCAIQIKKEGAKRPLQSAESCRPRPDHPPEKLAEGGRTLKAVKVL